MSSEHELVDHSAPQEPTDTAQWWNFSRWLAVAAAFATTAIGLWVLFTIREVLLVVLAAMMFAIGLDPLLRWFESRGWSRSMGMGTAVLGGVLVLTAGAVASGPWVSRQISEFGRNLPGLLEDLQLSLPGWITPANNGLANAGTTVSNALTSVGPTIGSAFSLVAKLLLVLVLGPYLAVALPSIVRGVARILGRGQREDFIRSLRASTTLVGHYIIGNLVVSLLAGVVAFAAFTALGVPYALPLALWIALVDAVPAVGATLGAIPALLIAATTGLGTLIGVAVVIVIYQQIENHLVIPTVMKRAVSLGPATVVIAILVGGALAGVLGVILSVPLTAMLKLTLFDRLLHERIMQVRSADANGEGRKRWWHPGDRPGTRALP